MAVKKGDEIASPWSRADNALQQTQRLSGLETVNKCREVRAHIVHHLTNGATVCSHLENNNEESGDRADNAQLLKQGPEGGLLCIGVIVHARDCAVILKARVMAKEECQDPCIKAHVTLIERTYCCSGCPALRQSKSCSWKSCIASKRPMR